MKTKQLTKRQGEINYFILNAVTLKQDSIILKESFQKLDSNDIELLKKKGGEMAINIMLSITDTKKENAETPELIAELFNRVFEKLLSEK